jgi:limonene-1,2-epoxide hydrolase
MTDQDPALANLLAYFDALERMDFDTAEQSFSADCEYHHPPYSVGHQGHEDDLDWHVARGHDELRALWEFRGPHAPTHHVTAFARNGNVCFNEAYADLHGDSTFATWVSVFTVDGEDKIVKYLSYQNLPALPVIGSVT